MTAWEGGNGGMEEKLRGCSSLQMTDSDTGHAACRYRLPTCQGSQVGQEKEEGESAEIGRGLPGLRTF